MFINRLLLLKATIVLSFVNINEKKGLSIKKIHSRLVTKQNTEKQNQKMRSASTQPGKENNFAVRTDECESHILL